MVSIAVIGGATLAGSAWITGHARDVTRQSLSTVLETTQQAVRSWVGEHRATVAVWAGTPAVIDFAEQLLEVTPTAEALRGHPAQAAVRTHLTPVLSGVGYRGFFVISRDGVNLASTRDANIGVPSLLLGQPGFLDQTLGGGTAMSLPQPSDVPLQDPAGGPPEAGAPTMFATAPIHDEDGSVIAVLAFRIDPASDFTAIFQRGRIGQSGETYGFDGAGRLITESRFDADLRTIGLVSENERGILNVEVRDPGVNLLEGETTVVPRTEQPFTLMASEAIAGRAGADVTGYRDYRGVRVVGAWLWDDEVGMGMTTEIDVGEAHANLRRTRGVLFSLSGLGALLVLLIARDAARRSELEGRLEDAMAKVLSGYLPICANCKRIRQEAGDWQPVEAHVSGKTDAKFSHTICPPCSVELYGEDFTK